ncbi:MAG: hypothetical protein AAF514_24775, partial [Verrucomicrobiota bacterium]
MGTKRPTVWKRCRYGIETLLFRGTLAVLPRLPRGAMLRGARLLAGMAYLIDRRGRTTALENLRIVFGDEMNPSERRRVARQSYENLGISVFDLIWSQRINPENLEKYGKWKFDGDSDVGGLCDKGAIWVTPHFGNFELMSILWGLRGSPISIVA